VIIPFLSAADNKMVPIFSDFNVANNYFSAFIDSGAPVNMRNTSVFYELPNYIKRRTSNICPNLSSDQTDPILCSTQLY